MEIDFKVTLTTKDLSQIITQYLKEHHQLEIEGEPKFVIEQDKDYYNTTHYLDRVECQVKRKQEKTTASLGNFRDY